MQLTINGEQKEIKARNIAELMDALGVDASQIAVECNRSIVPKSQYALRELAAGDAIEIVEFIGGG